MFRFVVIAVILIPLLGVVLGHGRLRNPPGRSSMWRDGYKTPKNYDDDQLYCGGLVHQHNKMGGKCGICGDPWDQKEPRQNELGGRYGLGIITRNYTRGQEIEVWVQLTTNHKGWFEFRVCPLAGDGKDATQECLNQHTLQLADGSGKRFQITNVKQMEYHIKLLIPSDITCKHCTFQWDWVCGNNWGICPSGKGAMGCGPQETFRGCADISIS